MIQSVPTKQTCGQRGEELAVEYIDADAYALRMQFAQQWGELLSNSMLKHRRFPLIHGSAVGKKTCNLRLISKFNGFEPSLLAQKLED